MTTTTRDHYLDVEEYPRTETTPAEVTVRCGCGLVLGDDMESAGGGIQIDPTALLEEHMESLEEDQ